MFTIALIAHDGKKDDRIRFARQPREALIRFRRIATGTTDEPIQQVTGPAAEWLAGLRAYFSSEVPVQPPHPSPPHSRVGTGSTPPP
ncbi:MAG TPA: hypothetical protein PL105_22810, partial [Caldilineaceae bacterium]|nr:hypothetical protein [Caldilineaceae bacterium]